VLNSFSPIGKRLFESTLDGFLTRRAPRRSCSDRAVARIGCTEWSRPVCIGATNTGPTSGREKAAKIYQMANCCFRSSGSLGRRSVGLSLLRPSSRPKKPQDASGQAQFLFTPYCRYLFDQRPVVKLGARKSRNSSQQRQSGKLLALELIFLFKTFQDRRLRTSKSSQLKVYTGNLGSTIVQVAMSV